MNVNSDAHLNWRITKREYRAKEKNIGGCEFSSPSSNGGG